MAEPTLYIWTAAESGLVTKTIGQTLKNFRPHIPPHKFLTCKSVDDAVVSVSKGDVVLACGSKPMEVLRRAGLAPKNRTVQSLREIPILSSSGGAYLFTFDPGITSSEPAKSEVIDWDVRLAVRLMRTGSLLPEIGNYQWVNSYQPTIDWIEKEYARTGKPVDVSCDTETETFYPWYEDRDIVSISFTAQPNTAHVLYTGSKVKPPIPYIDGEPLFDQIEWLLTSPKVKLRLANGKYDMIWIKKKWGIECTNFKFDTLLVGTLLNENRSNSLNLHAKVYSTIGGYDDRFNATVDKSKMGELPADEDFLTYAGGDTDACQQSADVLRDQLLDEPELARFYVNILHPAARAFEKIESRGVLVDQQKFHTLRDELSGIIEEKNKQAMDLLPMKIKMKYRDKIAEQIEKGKNPLTPKLLKEYFFGPNGLHLRPKLVTEKTQEPSMAKSHLRMFGDVPAASEMVDVLTEMDSASKTKSTFVDGFIKHIRPDGRLHPSYMLFHGGFNDDEDDESGSVSGRLSAKDPAIQTLPKKTKWGKRLRECYPAPPGKTIISIDYSQGELKVVACIAPEQTMLKSYMDGLDLHAVTGAQLAQVDLQTFLSWKDNDDKDLAELFDLNRSKAKPANFGLLYGMGAEGFQAYAWANYGLKLTLKEAEDMRNAFFNLYTGLPAYHERMKKRANFQESVVSPLGRIRHLPHIKAWDRAVKSKAERQAINSPVQSTLTDMMIWALAILDAELGEELETVAMIHDAFIAYVDTDKVQSIANQAAAIMSNLPFHKLDWKPQLKFTVDAEIGPDLAHLSKMKLAA